MKTNRKVLLAALATMVLATSVGIVACEKHERHEKQLLHEPVDVAPDMKSRPHYEQNKRAMLGICAKVDRAYAANPVAFKEACDKNEWEPFSLISGITSAEMEQWRLVMEEGRDIYLNEHPGFKPEQVGHTCQECAQRPYGSVCNVAESARPIGGCMPVVARLEPEDVMMFTVTCMEVCYPAWLLGPQSYGACVFACVAAMCLLSD